MATFLFGLAKLMATFIAITIAMFVVMGFASWFLEKLFPPNKKTSAELTRLIEQHRKRGEALRRELQLILERERHGRL